MSDDTLYRVNPEFVGYLHEVEHLVGEEVLVPVDPVGALFVSEDGWVGTTRNGKGFGNLPRGTYDIVRRNND